MMYLRSVWESHYCKIVFLISVAAGYFLIPNNLFNTWHNVILSIVFILLFATTITCVIRNIKERAVMEKTRNGSALSIIAVAIGVISLQVCVASAPVCGAAVGFGLISLILPTVALGFISQYGTYLIVLSILIQAISLYYMNCFKNMVSDKFNVKI